MRARCNGAHQQQLPGQPLKEQAMSRKPYSSTKQWAIAAALALGASGAANADDSSMNLFNGDSYAYFHGGQNFPFGKPVLDNAPSSWRATPPQDGLSFQRQHFPFELAVSAAATTYQPGHPQDPLAYRRRHFPFVDQTAGSVATNEAATASALAN
jgi:hypothetical protein